MKNNRILNGYLKSGSESIGPFAVELDFDKKLPGYRHKKGILYLVIDKWAESRFEFFIRFCPSNKEVSFVSEDKYSRIELKGFSAKSYPGGLSSSTTGDIEKLCEFTFDTFIERYGKSEKNLVAAAICFHIEDIVLFRPSLKRNSKLFSKDDKSDIITVNLKEHENSLRFETDDLLFQTACNLSGNEVSVSTQPILVVESKSPNLTEEDLINAGNNLLLILSFLEERFIQCISQTIHYDQTDKNHPTYEFRHTHHANLMKKPWRRDLEHRKPMDKFSSSDIKTMYLKFEHLTRSPKINFDEVIYLYLNAQNAIMIYYPIVNFYACIEKILKIGPKMIKDFNYPKSKEQRKHENKVKYLCQELQTDFEDLLNDRNKFDYVQIRHDYNHNLVPQKYSFDEIFIAMKKAGYLARRLIFKLLGLNYLNYNSCDPTKYGQIGL